MRVATSVVWLLLGATSAVAQDLDPRAYAKVPVGFTIATAGLSVSSGGVLTDPTLPVENAHAKVWTPSVGIAQSFGLFGRTAQTLVALPYSWAHVTGDVAEQVQQVDRSGLSDMRFRFSILLAGAGDDAAAASELSEEAHRWREPDGGRTDWSVLSQSPDQPWDQSVGVQA